MSADSVLSGRIGHSSDGETFTGTIPINTANDIAERNSVVTIPRGFYASNIQKTVIGPTTYNYEVTTDTIGSAEDAGDVTATYISSWTDGTSTVLGTAIDADDITYWSDGTAASATVSNGILTITDGVKPTLTYQSKSIPNVTTAGTAPSITKSDVTLKSITVTPTTVVTDVSEAQS